MNSKNNSNYIIIGLSVVAISGLALAGVAYMSNQSSGNTNGQSEKTNKTYKDGLFKANGSYRTPGGVEEISIEVNIKDGIIEDVKFVNIAKDQTSIEYQNKFIEGAKVQIVGKKIDNVSLSRVSGSSLTGAGFNDAINKIKSESKI
jgi:uncharacterized protein with FMN-binding domain